MKRVILAALVAVALFAWSLTRVSSDAVAMAIGMLLGVLGTASTQAMILLARRDEPATYIVQMPDRADPVSHLAYLDAPIGEVR